MFNENIDWNKLIEELRIYAVVYDYQDRIKVSVHTGEGDPDFIIYKDNMKIYLDLTNDVRFAHNLECWEPIHDILNIINKYIQKEI